MDELQTLKERVKIGNNKLIAGWPKIWDIQGKEERWQALDQWDKANRKLDALCMELMYRFNYRDCLYLDGNGHKTTPCTRADGFCCFVCPSETSYWRREDEVKKPAEAVQKKIDSFWGDS